MSEQPGRYQRSASGMVGALVVLLVLILGYLALQALRRDEPPDPVRAVDYLPVAEQARNDGLLAPAPDPLPEGWRATSVRYVPGDAPTWHLGLLTDRKKYVGIEEARKSAADLVEATIGDGATSGATTTLAGERWRSWSSSDGDRAYTRRSGRDTVLVGGSAGVAVLERVVTELPPAQR